MPTEKFDSSVRRFVHPDLETIKRNRRNAIIPGSLITRSKCMQCCILVAGDADSLYILTQTLEKNIPVIVITNSGGLSDIICKPFPDKDTKNASVVYKKYSNHIFELDKKDLINKDIVASVILKALRGSFVKEESKENESTDTRLGVPFSDDKFAYILICIQLDKLEEAESGGILKSLFRDESNSNAEQINLIQEKAINLDRSRFIQYLDEHFSLFETSARKEIDNSRPYRDVYRLRRRDQQELIEPVFVVTGQCLYNLYALGTRRICALIFVGPQKNSALIFMGPQKNSALIFMGPQKKLCTDLYGATKKLCTDLYGATKKLCTDLYGATKKLCTDLYGATKKLCTDLYGATKRLCTALPEATKDVGTTRQNR
ncbi:hypothetical protein Btru_047136 [Bulinus truncatus]|nr:hypothetical protein Btru_047136 [Bulinus truncatus]